MIGISRAEFARREGCHRSLVSRGARDGRLRVFGDGSVDPAQVGTAWRRGNATRDDGRDRTETPARVAARITFDEGHAPYSRAEAERIKENYLALLRRLEYDTKARLVAPRAEMVAEVADRYARIKTRLLPLGAEITPRLAPKSSKAAAEIKAEIDAAVRVALEELARPDDDRG